MTFIRSKIINGCGPYWYEVRSVREGKTVRQEHVRYIGKARPEREYPGPRVVPKEEPRRGFLDVGDDQERKVPKTWDRLRYDRARRIAAATGSSYFQADALAKTAWRLGLDPEKVDWEQLQGADLSYDEKVEKLDQMTAMNESDLLQFCVRHYLSYVKNMRALPEDAEFQFEEETQTQLT